MNAVNQGGKGREGVGWEGSLNQADSLTLVMYASTMPIATRNLLQEMLYMPIPNVARKQYYSR